jgi:hypothetical protein
MADNVAITAGAGTSVATDDVAGAHYQKVKLYDSTADSSTGIGLGNGTAATALRVTLPTDGTGVVGLNAGSNAIGKLAANTGVDIGDVDVTSVIPGTGATNLGKAEDAGHTTGDVGVMILGVRNDANASFGADLDYTPITTDSGGNQNVRSRKDLVRVTVQSGGLTTTASAYAVGDQVGTQFTIAGCARESGGSGMIVGVALVQGNTIESIGAMDVMFTDSSITLAADNAAYAISDADALKIVGMAQLSGAYDIGNNRLAQAYNLAIPYVCSGGTSLYASLITRTAIAATPFTAATDLQLIVYVERN